MANQSAPKVVKLENLQPQNFKKTPFILLAILIFLLGSASVLVIQSFFAKPQVQQIFHLPTTKKLNFIPFSSLEDFKGFLAKAPPAAVSFLPRATFEATPITPMEAEKATRVSTTNVQIKGIDEPDIAKTNGQEIFFLAPTKINTINAFPPDQLQLASQVDRTGEMLLVGQILVVFGNSGIYGYDVSEPRAAKQVWEVAYQNNHSLTSARLHQDQIYLITQRQINRQNPCPIRPLRSADQNYQVACSEIYHPTGNIPVDTTYTAFILDPQTGQIRQSLSFVGSTSQSVVFMSDQALFVTYSSYQNLADFYYQFLQANDDLFPQYLIHQLAKIKDYDLSNQTKIMEIQNLLNEYFGSLNQDEQLRAENEFANRWQDFNQAHLRQLEKTTIVKISLDKLEVIATGEVPGRPLNQFSLDEYQNYLRLATTLGQQANDVYILDNQLAIVGQITDLGIDERIYSARFSQDQGYLVTFRETDPFYVLDLKDPRQPKVSGELKIPGFSSYLHPLTASHILGIGREDGQVKLSLFDVSQPELPTEVSKYLLDDPWSEISQSHHAFLVDNQHQIFFLPASRGGYIFSFQNNQLTLKRAMAGLQARRAIYINDYLYILGDDQIIVLGENTWEEVNRLEIKP